MIKQVAAFVTVMVFKTNKTGSDNSQEYILKTIKNANFKGISHSKDACLHQNGTFWGHLWEYLLRKYPAD
ncbi:hypothetical protein NBC122_01799 [Chryseobacterium salivictor]|uniref:Uncharacterized protein n=1 Tax=Chryseobacterium salivictor TaxID=2547600 RepID=A0A4V1AL58_9FLAO|nr:hypothetical protein NBC122_01799 [Chryseobacterium salivictor]